MTLLNEKNGPKHKKLHGKIKIVLKIPVVQISFVVINKMFADLRRNLFFEVVKLRNFFNFGESGVLQTGRVNFIPLSSLNRPTTAGDMELWMTAKCDIRYQRSPGGYTYYDSNGRASTSAPDWPTLYSPVKTMKIRLERAQYELIKKDLLANNDHINQNRMYMVTLKSQYLANDFLGLGAFSNAQKGIPDDTTFAKIIGYTCTEKKEWITNQMCFITASTITSVEDYHEAQAFSIRHYWIFIAWFLLWIVTFYNEEIVKDLPMKLFLTWMTSGIFTTLLHTLHLTIYFVFGQLSRLFSSKRRPITAPMFKDVLESQLIFPAVDVLPCKTR